MEEPHTHYFEVVIDALEVKSKALQFVMPVWTPGSYLIREFSRNVLDLIAFDIDEESPLTSRKVAKNVWEIETSGATNVRVKYRVYAFELTVDTSYLDNVHGIINGASVFMYVEGMRNEKFSLTVIPPEEWKIVSTGLEFASEKEEGAWVFSVPNYDILVDSPIEVGNQDVYSFEVRGVRHEVSILALRELDEAEFVKDLKNIVETTVQVFGQIPYSRYVFIVEFSGESGGGLEHLNSTHCIAPMYRLEPVQEYRNLLSLFSHELFHAWNVKRMRPLGLGPFEYSKETYTTSLWIAEGITSYYDDLILRRAKIYSVGEYLDALCLNINIMKSLPGSKWQSAEESSFDTWIKHYRPNENSPNVHSSYYYQGALIGWMLDMEIRRATRSSKTLDDAMRLLYSETYVKENRGYKDVEFENICSGMTGREKARKIFDARVRGRKEIDFDAYLGYGGLKLSPKKAQQDSGFLGVRLQTEGGRAIVTTVLSDSPAQECGLGATDEIIAIDGIRMDASKLSWYVSNRKPETPMDILVSRFGRVQEIATETVVRPVFEYRIIKTETASEHHREFFREWLGEDWDKEVKYEEYVPSPAKKTFFDYV